ncbi:hypothetical protein HPB50_017082 [Hyalomma asiaticum]|uniref:Uncharacterized protein n=1 Tax=Hyalomma asiaticum TaxID=266040 RepID=A0ACB7TJV9_HYAAI|nr:hypothetical protein HPB50_017082 [Hyalomma asiaticum]
MRQDAELTTKEQSMSDAVLGELSDEEKERMSAKPQAAKAAESLIEATMTEEQKTLEKEWHKERRLRITSSSAHRIRTRLDSYDTLASSLARPRFFSSAATSYGKQMESEARAELSTALGTVIHEVKMHANFERKLETYATLSFADVDLPVSSGDEIISTARSAEESSEESAAAVIALMDVGA